VTVEAVKVLEERWQWPDVHQ